MAKQSGLHQIRGKVGEYSYYRQSGVASGLIRGINQGLSSRVKTGDEYANTRLNNAEFGAACNVAGLLGRTVTPKYRPMILPFSQSMMAKNILELAKAHPAAWGQHVVTTDDTATMAEILSETSKKKISDFMKLEIGVQGQNTVEASIDLSASQVSTLLTLGIDGLSIKITTYLVRTGEYSQATDRILRGYVRQVDSTVIDFDLEEGESAQETVTASMASLVPVVTGFNSHAFVTVVVMPYRKVNNSPYTLQEHCMFQSFKQPAQA